MSETYVYSPYVWRWVSLDNSISSQGTSPSRYSKKDPNLTVKRSKPKDLFANTTERWTWSRNETYFPATCLSAGHVYIGSSWNFGQLFYLDKFSSEFSDFSDLDMRVLTKIKDQKVNLGNFLAESGQTAKLVSEVALDIYRTFHSLRSGRAVSDFVRNLQHPRTRSGRALANRWLQFQYGLRPAMSDIQGYCQQMAKNIDRGIPQFVSVTDSKRYVETGLTTYGTYTAQVDLFRKVKARYVISSGSVKAASEVGAFNLAAVAWEVIPWSFAIDWVLPVGNWLNNLDALVGVSGLVVNRGVKRVTSSSTTLQKRDGMRTGYGAVDLIDGYSVGNTVQTHRQGASSSLSYGVPSFKNPASFQHMANALALIRQLKH